MSDASHASTRPVYNGKVSFKAAGHEREGCQVV